MVNSWNQIRTNAHHEILLERPPPRATRNWLLTTTHQNQPLAIGEDVRRPPSPKSPWPTPRGQIKTSAPSASPDRSDREVQTLLPSQIVSPRAPRRVAPTMAHKRKWAAWSATETGGKAGNKPVSALVVPGCPTYVTLLCLVVTSRCAFGLGLRLLYYATTTHSFPTYGGSGLPRWRFVHRALRLAGLDTRAVSCTIHEKHSCSPPNPSRSWLRAPVGEGFRPPKEKPGVSPRKNNQIRTMKLPNHQSSVAPAQETKTM